MTIVTRRITDLVPHPQQNFIFDAHTEVEIKELADDIAAHGLRCPVEVLPDNTIVRGHGRVRAASLLGWHEIQVFVLDSLAKQGAAAVERYLIEDNVHRRQLDKLQLARAYLRLIELEKTQGIHKIAHWEHRDLRDKLAERLGIGSGRTLDRYRRILLTPIEVQNAFRTGQLSLVDAGKVAALPEAQQQDIADAIRSGADPRKVLVGFLPKRQEKSQNPDVAFTGLIRDIRHRLDVLRNQVSKIRRFRPDDLALLEEFQAVIRRLLAQAKRMEKSRPQQQAKLAKACKDITAMLF